MLPDHGVTRSFGYLFAVLIYPLTAVGTATERDSVALRSVAPSPRSSAGPLDSIRVMAQVYGNALFATFLLFVGLATELWRTKRAGSGEVLNA